MVGEALLVCELTCRLCELDVVYFEKEKALSHYLKLIDVIVEDHFINPVVRLPRAICESHIKAILNLLTHILKYSASPEGICARGCWKLGTKILNSLKKVLKKHNTNSHAIFTPFAGLLQYIGMFCLISTIF